MKKVIVITEPQVNLPQGKINLQEFGGLDPYFEEGYLIIQAYSFGSSLLVVLEKKV